MSAEVSEQDIEREIQTLRNLRRRSGSSPGPGALAIDPDLPPPSPNQPGPSSPTYSSNDDITLSTPDGLDDGSLFWVPAHLHPELAPGEFRAFLKAHTHADPANADASEAGEAPGLARSPSWLARRESSKLGSGVGVGVGRADSGLGRKRSMLSRQYHPRAGDHVEEEMPPLPRSNRASIYAGRGGDQGLTLHDLQKLEMLVEQAGDSDDPAEMRKLLRRSLSLNVAPGFLQDDVPQGDDADEPIIVPRPGSILRRSARTKIRKANLPGDGGGHRFAATRRVRKSSTHDDTESSEGHGSSSQARKSSDESSEFQSRDESLESATESDKIEDAPQHIEDRRESDASTDEAVIFDAYRNSRASSVSSESAEQSTSPSPEEGSPPEKLALPGIVPSFETGGDWFGEGERTPTQENVRDPLAGVRRPSPGAEMAEGRPGLRLPSGMSLQVPIEDPSQISSSPTSPTSPTTPQQRPSALSSTQDLPPGMAPPQWASVQPSQTLHSKQSQEQLGLNPLDARPPLARTESGASASTVGSAKDKEKEKKGGFFSKKDKKDKERDSKKKDKDGFLGGLFSGKKKQEEPVSSVSNFSSAGPAAAAALLGSSKSAKSLGISPAPSPTSPGFSNFARYPIHVERAVYRLSHIKLANARRPLYEQVLISNLMFWYLGVIGRNVTEEKKANATAQEEQKKESEPTKALVAKGTPPKPADSGSAGTPPPRNAVLESPAPQREKKASLSKPERSRVARDNEVAVRPPQYGMQNAQVDSEMRQAQAHNLKAQAAAARAGGGGGSPPPHLPNQHQQHPHPPGGFPPGAAPPQGFNHNLPPHQRAVSGPLPVQGQGPHRATSPPNHGQPPRPGPDVHGVQNPMAHREVNGLPRAVPQSSFGPPPAANGPQPPFDDRRDPRQRTMSNPGSPPPQGAVGGPPPQGQMRRVVTDGRPQPGQIFSGPQPGQIFQYPSGAQSPPPPGSGAHPFPPRPNPGSPQPGQIYAPQNAHSPQPGQVFHHPSQHPNGPHPPQQHYRPPPGPGPRPLPEVGHHPHPQAPGGWQPPARLPNPPPADAPWLQSQGAGPAQGRPDFSGTGRRPSVSPDGYDHQRRASPGPGGYPGPVPGQGQVQRPHPGAPPPPGQGFYAQQQPPRQPAGTQPGHIFSPYPAQAPQGYRREAAPVQGPYAHHR
ncbi:hypothetical protein EHS25_000088 [Saitozyma podzolica]|uniref:Protein Zds1 C-terminal domain-containing protein n=1 Tax=Saitozyma podzolica TaxID=1890683 RepID=A0A427YV32_9TREE|nr:hypothetical protein EHS25_000088 [Saitozyma podzolica]